MPLLVSRVPDESIDLVWPQILPKVEKGLRHGEGDQTSPESLLQGIKSGELILWAIHDESIRAGVILSVVQHPCKKVLQVVLLAGEGMDEWIDLLISLLVEYRDLIGAESIEASCRFGLSKYLAKKGFRKKSVIMSL